MSDLQKLADAVAQLYQLCRVAQANAERNRRAFMIGVEHMTVGNIESRYDEGTNSARRVLAQAGLERIREAGQQEADRLYAEEIALAKARIESLRSAICQMVGPAVIEAGKIGREIQ